MAVLIFSFINLGEGNESGVSVVSKIIGNPAPDFSLPSLNGQRIGLQGFSGKPVILNFWATWCAPCKDEMPLLEAISKKYGSGLAVIAINEGDSLSAVKEFVAKENLDLQILLDEESEVGDLYKLSGYPTSVFIDGKGIIQAIYLGELSLALAERNLDLIGIEK